MTSNPLAAELKAADRRIQKARKHHEQLASDLAWHREFDRKTARTQVERRKDELGRLEIKQRRVSGEWDTAFQELNDLNLRAAATWSPASWFSTTRLQAIHDRDAKRAEAAQIAARGATIGAELESLRSQLQESETELARHEEFRLAAVTEEFASVTAELRDLERDRDALARRKSALDASLKEPKRVLRGLLDELAEGERTHSSLLQQINRCESDITQAEDYRQRLNGAGNTYEKRLIHEECKRRLGEGSPGAVMHDRRQQIKELKSTKAALEVRLKSARRNVEKAERRVQSVVERGLRDIRSLIIDGSNVCYRPGSEFIGLAALSPLCTALAERFEVTVVFDASTRSRLGISEAALRAALPKVAVHVAPAQRQADETILAISGDPYTFIVSRDRFADYADKPAVRERRLLPHEIVGNSVMVRDLDVTVFFITP